MDLTVDVDGQERVVSGLTESTNCAQVIYALAHATSQKGKFVLVERFRNAERRLSPEDRPLEMLAKWKEHAKNVSFMLRKVDDSEKAKKENNQNAALSSTYESTSSIKRIVPPHFTSNKVNSTSSVQSAFASTGPPRPAEMSATCSSSSLPAYSVKKAPDMTVRARPPPPDYASVMERRFHSLSRDNRTRTPLDPSRFAMSANAPISSMNLSQSDLMALIDKQRATLEKQRERLYELEVRMPHEEERELLQLEKQIENLREILQPIRDSNWPQQYNEEYATALRLKIAIESTKEAINRCQRELDEKNREAEELTKQLFEMMTLEDSAAIGGGIPQMNGAVQMQAY